MENTDLGLIFNSKIEDFFNPRKPGFLVITSNRIAKFELEQERDPEGTCLSVTLVGYAPKPPDS